MADDWTAVRLRGGVFALENGAWTQLVRGSVVPDDRVIKSAPGGRITLVRGAETIELGPDTTAQISDKSGFTTVYNHEGTVGIDAEARNVQHFAVQTPFLAAVVKGTAFTVQSNARASTVSVARGTVAVADTQSSTSVNVEAGEQVSAAREMPITAQSVVVAPRSAPKPPEPAALQPKVRPIEAASAPGITGIAPGQIARDPGKPGNAVGRPADKGPGGNGPADKGPDNKGPSDRGPGSSGPSDKGSADSGPGNGGPGNSSHGDTAGSGHGPADSGPGDKGPGGPGPGDKGPAGNHHGG